MPGKTFAGNPISKFLSGRPEQVERWSSDPVLGKPAKRNSRAIQVERRNARIGPRDVGCSNAGHLYSDEFNNVGVILIAVSMHAYGKDHQSQYNIENHSYERKLLE
jgi:hypothetical protein